MPVDVNTAKAMIQAMRKGKDAEAAAQSAFYTREPGRGGTGIDEEMEKNYGAKISPEEFKSKMPVGKTVLYGGTKYKVLENTGYVLTLQSLENGKIKKVNLNQFISQGAIKENNMKLKNPKKADLDKDGKLSSYEKTRGAAIEKNVKEADTKTYAGVDAIQGIKKDPRFGTLSGDAKMDIEKELKMGSTVELEEEDNIILQKLFEKYGSEVLVSRIQLKENSPDDDEDEEAGWMGADDAKDMMREYVKERGNDNLMEHMDKYRKRTILMESAMKRLFTMFDDGMTDEEVVQDHATKGVQVPEAFISKLRKQWETLKKSKLELEMGEKEYKNVARDIVNNPAGSETGMEPPMEEKQLSSGLTNETINKTKK